MRHNGENDDREKGNSIRIKRAQSIAEVLEEVEVLVDAHFFNELSKTKSSLFLKRVENQKNIDIPSSRKRGEHSTALPRR